MNDKDRAILYCQLESLNAAPEYGEGERCARFLAVQPREFSQVAFEGGITSITLDVAMKDLRSLMPQGSGVLDLCGIPDCDICSKIFDFYFDTEPCVREFGSWFRIEFSEGGLSYMYPTFGEVAPSYLTVTSITRVSGFPMPAFRSYNLRSGNQDSDYIYSAFEVGQGMASLIYNDTEGYLIDAGAGTPIKRDDYQNGLLTVNDLMTLVESRSIQFFLSHGDEDHWRMLSWDEDLRKRIVEFVVPNGLRSIAFFDTTVRDRVCELGAHVIPPITLGKNTSLTIYRTKPQDRYRTLNNDGLVAVFEKDGKKVLAAGDCVYADMKKDTDAYVQNLPKQMYAAVVVPHHGDEASAKDVPSVLPNVGAIAFFSAGDHKAYLHPRTSSKDKHSNAGFSNHVNKTPTGITEVKLVK